MLRVEYDKLGDSAKKLIDEQEIFDACIKAMDQNILALPDIWEAETCVQYVDQWKELKPDFEATSQLIEDMSTQMKKISDNFAQADKDMKGQMQK